VIVHTTYGTDVYNQKVDAVYQHVYESYGGEGKSIYAVA
jgi:type I restriction enzyme, R subunit